MPRAKTDQSLLEWMERNRPWLRPGLPLDFDRRPYLRDLYRCEARKVVLMKSSQVGVSEYLISWGMYGADVRQATVLYVFPTDSAVSDFSTARIGPAIEASPYLSRILVDASATDRQRGADRVKLKRIRDRFIYLRGATMKPDGRAQQLEAIDADLLIVDELDEMDARAPEKARKRTSGIGSLNEERCASIPSNPNTGIHAEWLASDRRNWLVRCDHCQHRQPVTLKSYVTEFDDLDRPIDWHGKAEGKAWPVCERCSQPFDTLLNGEWVAEVSNADTVGFHVTKLIDPLINFDPILRNLASPDATKRREAMTHDVGLPYSERGSQLTESDLDAWRRDYDHLNFIRSDDSQSVTAMGVDVGRLLHVVIRSMRVEADRGRAQIWAGSVRQFDELDALMLRYNVECVVIDALPETRMALSFQQRHPPGRVWLAYYFSDPKRVDPITWNYSDGQVSIDRTRSLDSLLAGFASGELTLPRHARDVEDCYAHWQSIRRVLRKDSKGNEIPAWVEVGADHMVHAENYVRAAILHPPIAQRMYHGLV
jgi:hypothetical protein